MSTSSHPITVSPAPGETPITHNSDCTMDGLPERAERYRMETRTPGHKHRTRTVSRASMLRDLALFHPGGIGAATARGRVIHLRINIPGQEPSERIYRPITGGTTDVTSPITLPT